MSFDVKALSVRKAKETGESELEWLRALESARQSLKFIEVDYPGLEMIALASRTAGRFVLMTRMFYQYGKSHPHGDQITDVIVAMVNASPYSLSDWVDAIDCFHQWLNKNGRKVDFLPMLRYLECCVASPEAKAGGQSFAQLVADMLDVAGYEG